MMAMLWAQQIMLGKKTYAQVPRLLKDKVKEIADEFDHALIMEKDTLKTKTIEALREEDFRIIEVKFRPTAENFARYFYDRIKQDGYDVSYVEVYETPNNCAIYGE